MLLVVLTSALGVIAISALLAPVPQDGAEQSSTRPSATEARSSPATVATDLDPARGRPFVLSASRDDQVVAVPRGAEARIEVHVSEPVSVQLGEGGPIAFADPGTPAEFTVFGEAGAEGPIRVLEPTREIGRVELAG